jgi:hypothetical protein
VNQLPALKKVVVLIFTHKAEPDAYERLSFQQCYKVLGKHPIRLVCPRGMDISRYREMVPGVVPDFIDTKWFRSLRAYNLMKVLPWLYRRYAGYEFMLTYELDAWVFRDELLQWCEQGWDYIGAPWFERFYKCSDDSPVLAVGNSGFSLRSIPKTRAILRQLLREKLLSLAKDAVKRRRSIRDTPRVLASAELLYDPFEGWIDSDDLFWSFVVGKQYPSFGIAPYELARAFAFEANARRLYAENNGRLPFGCHKWTDLQPDFWRDHIPFPSQ